MNTHATSETVLPAATSDTIPPAAPLHVLLVNGSPHKKGCTYTALREVADTLEQESVTTEILWLGNAPIEPCLACWQCKETGRCVRGGVVNQFLEKAERAGGFVFGSPVHFAAASGILSTFMSRAFLAGAPVLQGKPAAAVVSCRRGGAASAFDQINKYFTIRNMPVVPSQYWNMVHGWTPEDVRRDKEGMQTMRTLGRNMAWMLRCFELGRHNGISFPELEPWEGTDFIR